MFIDECADLNEIVEGLYVGNLRSLALLSVHNITHVLSVVNFPLTKDLRAYKTLHISLADHESSNLLQHFPAAIAFIDSALVDPGGGRVLVHCQAGMSRSVTVAAAWLMRRRGLDPEAAIQLIQDARPIAEPNEGFVAQLGLFHDMKCSLNASHPVYRMWCHEEFSRQYQNAGYVDPGAFAQLPSSSPSASTSDAPVLLATQYRCRKCRQVLATSDNVLPLDAAMGHKRAQEAQDMGHWRTGEQQQQQPQSPPESSLFLEPMAWMSSAIVGPVQGKLYCPGCQARLGSFNWSGITNTSGAWVTPAFQLHLSKLDNIDPRPLEALATVRHPTPGSAALMDTGGAPVRRPLIQPSVVGINSSVMTSAASFGTEVAPLEPQTAWFTHLILDCDGVMVDSERASCESLRQAILEVTGFDIPHEFPHDYEDVFGMDVRSCVAHYQAKFDGSAWGDAEEVAARVLAAKEGHYRRLTEDGIAAFAGAEQLLWQAEELGMAVGVGSSGAPEKIHHNLTSSGLMYLMDLDKVVSALEVAAGKPAPDVYLEVMKRTRCQDPRRAVVIEDAVNGLKAAKAAGAFAVGISNSLPAHKLAPYADLVISHLSEIDLATLTPPAAAKLKEPVVSPNSGQSSAPESG